MFGNANSLGFFTSTRAQNAQHLIGRTERFVADLDLTLADLQPAEDALSAAKALYAAHDYSEAVAQAERAAGLAVRLNERFNGYMAAWSAVQDRMEELRHLGLPTADLEAVLGAAEKEVVRQVQEDGAVVPNYVGAAAMLTSAAEDARNSLILAREASREIFLASLAVESLSGPQSTTTPSWLVVRLEAMIEQATRELALGNVPTARTIASEAKTRADEARTASARVRELLEEAEVVLAHLGAEGSVVDRLEERIRSARDALGQGYLDSTRAMVAVRHLSNEVTSLADQYPRARKVLEHAERVYARLQREGFCSYEVDEALREARRALGAGEWSGVRENVRRALQAFVRRQSEQEALARAITEIRDQVSLLEDLQVPLLPDVQEILGRAKEEFQSGRLSGANEDLLFATALVTQAMRSGT